MGSAFARLFKAAGHEVLAVDRPPQPPWTPLSRETRHLPLAGENLVCMGSGSSDSSLTSEEAVAKADVVMFAVPISVTVETIRQLVPLVKKDSLVCDITSIKGPAVEAMTEFAPSTCEVVGLHPMCGPSGIDDLTGQVVAVCAVRKKRRAKWLLDFLTERGAFLKRTSAEQHDHMMAIVQGLTHLSAIAGGMALKALGVDLKEALEFSSPVYKLRFGMIGRVLSQDPRLYAEIQMENPESVIAMKAYAKAVAELTSAVERKDEADFQRKFSDSAEYLGDFAAQSKEMTDGVLKKLKIKNEKTPRLTPIKRIKRIGGKGKMKKN